MKITIDTLAKFLGKSERTAWRLVSDNLIKTVIVAGKTKVELDDVRSYFDQNIKHLTDELIERCDLGDAAAETDIAVELLELGNYKGALIWLNSAVNKDHPDALQILGDLNIKGVGTEQDHTKGIMLISKAATLGHHIAIAQMESLANRFTHNH